MALLSVFEVMLGIICFVCLWCLRNKAEPGPKYFPVVGMMPELIVNIHRIHEWCTGVLERCGCTFYFRGPWLANVNFFVTCDPANIHYIMSSNFYNFPKGEGFKEIFDILGDGIFNADMDLWKLQRKAAQGFMRHHLFHHFLVKTSRAKVQNGLIPLLDHVAHRGSVVNLEDVFQRYTFDSICILATGYDPQSLSLEFPEVLFSKALDDAEEAIFYRHARPRPFVKFQKWLNIGQERKYREAWQVLDDILGKYIGQKREELNKKKKLQTTSSNNSNIIDEKLMGVDLLTSFITEEKTTGLKSDDKFLRDIILSLMLAGRDTTSSALTWFFWLISKHPQVETKIIEELESTLEMEGAGAAGETEKKKKKKKKKKRVLFDPEQVKNLVYLHGALCEAIRLYPPVPFQHKEPVKPDTLPSGHRIHPKMQILFNLYAMGRMKSIWGEDCYEFKPERWISERGGIKHEPSYKFLSFNAGPRTCIGKEVAFVQMKAVASSIIYNYNIHVLEDIAPVVPAISIILHTKDGLMAKLSSRWGN